MEKKVLLGPQDLLKARRVFLRHRDTRAPSQTRLYERGHTLTVSPNNVQNTLVWTPMIGAHQGQNNRPTVPAIKGYVPCTRQMTYDISYPNFRSRIGLVFRATVVEGSGVPANDILRTF